MSTCTHESMTNHHAPLSLATIAETFHVWRERAKQRRELAQWSERDIHDAGFSVNDVMAEAGKPFWQA
ncbi:Uncharacterized conserved protein YjiS, DUF1127 family [Bradyrhizobium sp. NFR13]|uniref:DUF1127 domain-containing protein n=1 Tax=Bradyrhizobium sp. NFR13 TaxID=1566285 RepID=UPI0008E80D88|nr:DUF1127 domain-containing protein [Bradyrhizobium sp. NFR13]SFL78953.1 Uncharacterized conserved protein YjiS, DUF1127 family [Bradyrhizobium sp. NFR13]